MTESGGVLSQQTDDRIARERMFHDAAYSDARRERVSHFYRVTTASRGRFRHLCLDLARDASSVLEYGCGQGSLATDLACGSAHVTGIDISPVAIAQSAALAEEKGVATRTTFEVMDAERLGYDDASFDVVCGCAILHHLDLVASYGEVARVLRPGGRAVFLEPLGHNPAINWYRDRTPELRTPDEAPLRRVDLDLARRWFGTVEIHYFELLTLAAIPFSSLPGFRAVVNALGRADQALFKVVPSLTRHAWFAILLLGQPDGARARLG